MILPEIADGEDKTSILANRIRKNYRHLRKWAKRTVTDCFRLYDRDIQKYPFAIDFYAGRFSVQYFGKKDDDEIPDDLAQEVKESLRKIFGIDESAICFKIRAKTKTTRQYEKKGELNEFFDVLEYGVRFRINLEDYLDTGLFLDHRETRQLVAKNVKGKRVLNLFSYTAAFSVHAAANGASSTKSVDMSNTYCLWARNNFILNDLPLKNNVILRADCMKFLQQEKALYDVIVIDPPTISRSKKMDQIFDVQKDYVFLIEKALQLLSSNGIIFFSTNSRKFEIDPRLFPDCKIINISSKTVPQDFRNEKIHQCWTFQKGENGSK